MNPSYRMPYIPPPDPKLFYAETVCNRIEKLIAETAEKLTDEQSILAEVPLGNGQSLTATFFGFQNPNFILVYGLDANGNEVTALLPHTNIQVIITVLNKPAERKSIGFQRSSDNSTET